MSSWLRFRRECFLQRHFFHTFHCEKYLENNFKMVITPKRKPTRHHFHNKLEYALKRIMHLLHAEVKKCQSWTPYVPSINSGTKKQQTMLLTALRLQTNVCGYFGKVTYLDAMNLRVDDNVSLLKCSRIYGAPRG